jgi:hypothetical protein
VEISELYGDGKQIGQLKKVRFAPKGPALDSLARHLGMFSESESPGASLGFQIILHLGQGADEPKPAIELPRTRTIGTVQ